MPAFATGDLFARHPSSPELWRVAGRKDDQIMHSNGEKTNPGPIGEQQYIFSHDCDVNFGIQSRIYHNQASRRRKGIDVRKGTVSFWNHHSAGRGTQGQGIARRIY